MVKITPEILTDYRLVKITYDHTIKEFERFEMRLEDEERATILKTLSHLNNRIRKRNNIVDWIWAPIDDIDELIDILDQYELRYKITDHTTTYYRSPEKLSVLREEIDNFLSNFVDSDFVLDRICNLGIENISKYEIRYIENISKE